MSEKRNALIDAARVAAAAGIILSHVDMTGYGAVGAFFSQFLSVRFPLMFFLATIGFYVEKSCQAGETPILRRICSLARLYGVWSLVYLVPSFVQQVLIQKMPMDRYLVSRVTGFLFSGSYYHFWFFPAVIYALLLIGGAKKLLGQRAISFLLPFAAAAYAVGLLGTGYLPVGRLIPGLCGLYAAENFGHIMHLFFLGFPAVVFGMAAAPKGSAPTGRAVLLAAAAYVAEAAVLCLLLGWREDPQMLITTPLLTVVFLRWAQSAVFTPRNGNPALFRTVSTGMYCIHPLFLAAFAFALPNLKGLSAFLICTACSAFFGWALYRLRKIRFFRLFV